MFKIAANINPVGEMSTENLAGIEAIKAKFTMGVYQDARVPLEASRKAEEMDPTFAAWKYLTGKIISTYYSCQKTLVTFFNTTTIDTQLFQLL